MCCIDLLRPPLHCLEIAAPFVALWYSLGVILGALTGAVVGSRFLRW